MKSLFSPKHGWHRCPARSSTCVWLYRCNPLPLPVSPVFLSQCQPVMTRQVREKKARLETGQVPLTHHALDKGGKVEGEAAVFPLSACTHAPEIPCSSFSGLLPFLLCPQVLKLLFVLLLRLTVLELSTYSSLRVFFRFILGCIYRWCSCNSENEKSGK